MDKITLTTADGLQLSGLYWNNQSDKSVLLLHMMPALKESWESLGSKLSALGMNVLAIDFRGHGESSGGNYETFTPAQHQAYLLDAETAVQFLQQQQPETAIMLGGASIGANITIQYMSQHHEVTKGFCLSAGLDYFGVKAIEDVTRLADTQELLLVGARDDVRRESDCATMAEQLVSATSAKVTLKVLDTGGHGNYMYQEHPELEDEIINYLV